MLTYILFLGYGGLILGFSVETMVVFGMAYRDKCKVFEQIFWFILEVVLAAGASVAYFVGDNMNIMNDAETSNDSEEVDLTVISILILIGAKLGFKIIPHLVKCGKSFSKATCMHMNKTKINDSYSPDKNNNSPNEVQFYESLFYAVILTMAVVPEVDTTYTILYNLVSLTTNMCRTRKYNVLWVIYGGIMFIVMLEIIYGVSEAFIKGKQRNKNTKGRLYNIFLSIIAVLAIVSNGFFFVADNELPLDCTSPFNIMTHTRANYKLRVAFLTVSLAFSLVILVIGISSWSYFLYQYYLYKKSKPGPSNSPKGETVELQGKVALKKPTQKTLSTPM
ncbi:PREDICTED: uncharacterized protein LOC109582535 isoform X2 [Amphimedon queenslandica]|nr:PREDICTED: uncharacterized protein LOC109582535 isoform X2 [Amphimedon queenslandica]|eukprot:XP_019852838.1 PREDICTED: uncharacterized protein LOC109582535 isoform X2 [Amphimedon queenslandica]